MDRIAPNITGLINLNRNATGEYTPVTFTKPNATDLGQDVDVLCDRAVTSNYTEGTTAVNCNASDGRGNTALATFTVTVGE